MKKIILSLFAIAVFTVSCKKEEGGTTTPDPIPSPEPDIVNVQTFKDTKVAFGNGASQSAEGTFTFPTDVENIKSIKVYIKDICPNKTCDEWDRYANLYAKDKQSNVWYEIGRFITPYWVGTEKLERGLEIDVTDFKSLLKGETELKIYTETWNAKGRTYTIDFDIEYGEPDYKYYSVAPVIQYNKSSIDGVPYGKEHDFDLTKNIQLPSGTEKAYLRTIISGWGHATPATNGRPCAEWCYKTHHIWINNAQTFEHYLGPLGCANNPINNQSPGNWKPNRAGWCPGMVVPNRVDELNSSLFNDSFTYEYKLQNWTDDGNNPNGAFYAISSFVIAKSNQPLQKPVVTD
ncbi:MAG: peptidase [Flavobacteriales bacterium]|nr:MAG: peptidase [Flavobacteriales bacterium]